MKNLLSVCLFVLAASAWAGEKPAPAATPAAASAPASVKGEVLEVKEVESYTYLRLKTKDGETWVAVAKAPVKKGAQVTIDNPMVMNNFESKALKQTFKTILFGNLAGVPGASGMPAGHGASAAPVDLGDIHVPKATGANARTVAEVITKGAELKDKPVVVRGKVVKYNASIMGKNWVHLRDGTGTAPNNDILVTTTQSTKLGDVVTVKGVVHTEKDFGSGYAYKVLIEEATLQP